MLGLSIIPTEVQYSIWEFVSPPRIHRACIRDHNDGASVLSIIFQTPPPAFSVCSQSRAVARRLWRRLDWRGCDLVTGEDDVQIPYTYCNPATDIILVPTEVFLPKSTGGVQFAPIPRSPFDMALLKFFNNVAFEMSVFGTGKAPVTADLSIQRHKARHLYFMEPTGCSSSRCRDGGDRHHVPKLVSCVSSTSRLELKPQLHRPIRRLHGIPKTYSQDTKAKIASWVGSMSRAVGKENMPQLSIVHPVATCDCGWDVVSHEEAEELFRFW